MSHYFPNHNFIRIDRDTKLENVKKNKEETFFYTQTVL